MEAPQTSASASAQVRKHLADTEMAVARCAAVLALWSQLLATLGLVLVALCLPLALVTAGAFAIGVAVGAAVGCGAVLLRSAVRRHEALDRELLRLRACDPVAARLVVPDQRMGHPEPDGWVAAHTWVVDAEHVSMCSPWDLAISTRTKLQVRRLTSGVAALVDLVPEAERHAEVPVLRDLASSVDAGVDRLQTATARLSRAASRLDATASTAITTTTLRDALAETLIGPADVSFDGWQVISVEGEDGDPRWVEEGTIPVDAGERVVLEVAIGAGDEPPARSGAIPLASHGTRTPAALDFRVDLRGIGVTLDPPSRAIRWISGEGPVQTTFGVQPRDAGAEIYVTTHLGPRLMQSKRFKLGRASDELGPTDGMGA